MEETNDQVGREESAAPSSSGKKPRENRIRLPARFASRFFDLTNRLGFSRDAMTVEWLMQKFQTDQDPRKFSSVDELLINYPQEGRRRPAGRSQVTKDRHLLTEDGRDRRVRVPDDCLAQLIDLTGMLALKSNGETIEWLFKKYWSVHAIQSTKATNSTSRAFTDTNFNGAQFIPTDSSITSYDHQENLVGHDKQQQLMEPAPFKANPNSRQYGIAKWIASNPCDLYLRDSANCLQSTSYPQQQQTVIHPDSINFQSWMRNATNDGLIMEGRRVEPLGQICSLPNSPYLYHREHECTRTSNAMAGERLAGPAGNFSSAEQVWNPTNTRSTSIPETYCLQNQYPLPYERIINGNRSGIAISSAYVQQLFSQGVVGNGLGEGPINPQDHRDIGEIRQPAQSIINNNNDAISMNLRDLRLQLCYQGMGGA